MKYLLLQFILTSLIYLIKNYQIIALDVPAHGNSDWNRVNGLLYAQVIEVVMRHFSPQFVVGHSFAGIAYAYYFSKMESLPIEKMVLMGVPDDLTDITEVFFQTLGANEKVKAAYFEHKNEPIYAFEFETDSEKGIIDYFTDDAKNLRRAFLKSPVKFGRLSSRYNLKRRIAYYGYKIRPHKGTDFAAPVGTPIMATANGTVIESTRRGGNGKYVKIRHNSTYSTQYLHMKNRNVKVGDYVKQGQTLLKITNLNTVWALFDVY